jgi:hypothetical protein
MKFCFSIVGRNAADRSARILGRTAGSIAEGLAFQGDSSPLNPMRYIPSPAHTKLWQERTPLAQYINNEVSGTRMRRWQRPIHGFLMPYLRGAEERLEGQVVIPGDVQRRRDLNILSERVVYLQKPGIFILLPVLQPLKSTTVFSINIGLSLSK